ncbi:hypothetical protein FIM41_06065 [Helicobacter pylori]|nr:hypothetical protein FIM41_06065 [Helicobacter pylori]
MLTFRVLKRGKLSQKHPLVNEVLETHLAKTKGFVFHACHPLLATHCLPPIACHPLLATHCLPPINP